MAQQDYVNAADCYERLTLISPENTSYWLYYAQCLKKAGFPAEAMKVVNQVASRCDPETIRILKASIRYQEEESHECKVSSFSLSQFTRMKTQKRDLSVSR